MSTKTHFQEFITRVVKFMLQDDLYLENWDKSEYKKFLGENLRRYSEFTSDHKNIVNNIGRLKQNCKFTIEAIDEVNRANSNSWNDLKKVIHQEHILPISEAIRQLSAIQDKKNEDSINEVLNKLEIIVISKRQRDLLDGATGVGLKSKGETQERLDAINAKIHEDYYQKRIK